MTKDKRGNLLKEGDMIDIDPSYGGGTWQIIQMLGGFIVAINRSKMKKSFSAADGVKSKKQPYFESWDF